jgi:hypothetical protein
VFFVGNLVSSHANEFNYDSTSNEPYHLGFFDNEPNASISVISNALIEV